MKKMSDELPVLWTYNHTDMKTWPWVACNTFRQRNGTFIVEWIKNPGFKFAHLMKNY